MVRPVLTPEAVLLADGRPESADQARLAEAADEIALLLLLAGPLLTAELGAEWAWLRQWPQQFCTRLGQTQDVAAIGQPDAGAVERQLASAPPWQGGEYLTAAVLERWWQALAARAAEAVAAEGLDAWLGGLNPLWQGVGRVTFHLAENRTDSQRPFAFLATHAGQLGASGQLQHRPLARALQQAVGSRDAAAVQVLLAPVRAAAARSELLEAWLLSKRLFQPQALTAEEAYRFLCDCPRFQQAGIVVKLPDWWQGGRPPRPVVTVTLEAPRAGSLHAGALLGFQVEASLQGEPLTETEWQRLLSAETGLVSLRGRWVEVDAGRLQQALEHWRRVQRLQEEGGVDFHQAMRWLAGWQPRAEAVALPEAEARDWSRIVAGRNLEGLLAQLELPTELPEPPGLRTRLRPYQRQGLAWLDWATRMGLGVCLADDMGLGKTLQVLALLLRRRETARLPALLVVPASLLGNWRAEAERFAPDLRWFTGHASVTARDRLEAALADPRAALDGVDVVLTTYAFLQRAEAWQVHPWGLVVLDEAQAIKNPASLNAQAVKRLQAPARIALTGTPVENRPGDLWSLFDFLNPGLLGSPADFAAALQRAAAHPEGFAPLRRLLRPYLLRRMKTDRRILPDLPEKTEVKAWCGLTRRQTAIYAKLVDQLARMLNDPGLDPERRQGLMLGFLTQFKQVCNHPSHWNGDGVWEAADSGKFLRLREICAELAERRERVLVFTQFQETCAPLARLLADVFGREGLVLHGGVPVAKRAARVAEFQQPGGPPFLVVSVKTGGTGLNLTAASHVIHFDRWWNPAVENQATDRAFRIGQQRNVLVHKFVCQGTLEQRIDALLEQKQALAEELVGGAEALLGGLSAAELLRLVSLDVNAALV